MSLKEELLTTTIEGIDALNSMGCDESWYIPGYAIQHVFDKYEIEEMTEEEIDNLWRLATAIQAALY